MKRALVIGILAGALLAQPALAADKVKIGFITTLSGPEAVLGNPMRDSANLALSMLGGKIGGVPAEIVYGDDQQKPDVGRQLAEKMLQKDRVDFVTGMLGSNVLLAVYQQVVRTHTILISANAGPHQFAGDQCSPYYFNVAQQSDESSEAMGQYLHDKNIKNVYAMAPDYNAGKDMVGGFERYLAAPLAGEAYTPFGQLDYQPEISRIRAAKPGAVFVFYPGGMGIQFVKQFAQSGLKDEIPFYSTNAIDEVNLPVLKAAAVGDYTSLYWGASLDIPRNHVYLDAFRKRYHYTPNSLGAGSFDAIFLIDSAVKAVHGNLADKAALIAAMEKADFQSVRGPFSFNTNHHPIENFYLFRAVKTAEGYGMKTEATIFTAHKDHYYQACHMAKP